MQQLNKFKNGGPSTKLGASPCFEKRRITGAYLTKIKRYLFLTALLGLTLAGCRKFLEIDAPKTAITQANVYQSDQTASQVLTGIYAGLSASMQSLGASFGSLFYVSGLSADEFTLYDQTDAGIQRYYQNNLSSKENEGIWGKLYTDIFTLNSAIEGLNSSTTISPTIKKQLLGEAKFMRAFYYFYLVNCYGDVPLVLGTDPEVNRSLPRVPKATVYMQIENDLKEAKALLNEDFLDATLLKTTSERVRPTKWAAGSLLARAYLYDSKFNAAEKEADSVINSGRFALVSDLNKVFLKNSDETIWALQQIYANATFGYNTAEGRLFILPSEGPNAGVSPSYPVYLSDYTINNFEGGDLRRTSWIDSVVANGTKFRYAYKYKSRPSETVVKEYSIVLRLAEQYLIRAEARARQSNIPGAVADLNLIRARARSATSIQTPNPLPPLSTSLSAPQVYVAIEHERQSELFTEWGHRWLDLKRTPGFTDASSTRADEVMSTVTRAKGGNWSPNWKLYPIPIQSINANPNLAKAQNPGY
ncbi:RagB/SusD family nutrient uptake outer membrane protein [Pararcticibacter amylolyticus]|uniref:RagB/SusD family nutrient uptake outer membrane protein n=1 Tax=Pararcticibacter amylolyticus TaxID=2173175 RepID=A0A2U2PHT1_9SPHI|nr:RagB/SusD family nutrient uptake outer membrane protein [Pararcticibacter amylolyticus]PWG80822.1 RagB/SusD family nutrient uptake outer membrane protein [Pararcticibacter amylolyticus]